MKDKNVTYSLFLICYIVVFSNFPEQKKCQKSFWCLFYHFFDTLSV